ncbi:ATP-binding protein [Azospirillaceae bacterium]
MAQTMFDICRPRDDVASGTMTDADFAADLAQVINGSAPPEYRDAEKFFATTYPTRGLKNLLENVCRRLGGGSTAASVFRLDTSFGGGKTHGLIALVHAARGMSQVPNASEFINSGLLPRAEVRVAEFDGENADPLNGRSMGDGVFAKTPWGEIAYRLAGRTGYERVQASDEQMVAPGAETMRELFGGKPTLILLDEMSDWLRKVYHLPGVRDQLSPFLKGLFKAVEATPTAAVVFTLAIGKSGKKTDAHADEAMFIADRMAEAESVAARKATLLNPTEDDETAFVLRRRLFKAIDMEEATKVIAAYKALWSSNKNALPHDATLASTVDAFAAGYPFHPDVLEVLTSKTATLGNFQRVRGMLRLLGRTVALLWQERPADATAIHVHHIDPGYGPIHQEIVTRLGQSPYVPAIRADISAEQGKKSLAQEIDDNNFSGLPPYTEYVARTAFVHTLAFQDALQGVTPERLRFSMLAPMMDISFIDNARLRFIQESAYIDDRPNVPLRFQAEANLNQLIRRTMRNVDPGELRSQLYDRIKQIFSGQVFDMVPFPHLPVDVPDDVNDGRPRLAVVSYDAVTVGGSAVDEVPEIISRIYKYKGSDGSAFRHLRNNLVFVVADASKIEDMRVSMMRRLALAELKKPERLAQLADHQQAKVRELESRSETAVTVAIQQTYRHIFYPTKNNAIGSTEIGHSAIEISSASEKPGSGQQQVVRGLRDLSKLRLGEDEPDSPTYIRDRTPLKKGQISTANLREEFRRDPGLAILADDEIFKKAIRKGVELGVYVYRRGDLLYGKGDPSTSIQIDQDAIVFTMSYAAEHGFWPRKAPPSTPTLFDGHSSQLPLGVAEVQSVADAFSPTPVGTKAHELRHPTISESVQTAKETSAAFSGPLSFSAEGVLKEALKILWEQARSKKVAALTKIGIDMYDSGDAFRLLGMVGAVQGARKTVTLLGGYETTSGSTMTIEFEGSTEDAKPVKDFIEPQFRAAKDKNLKTKFVLEFDGGLPVSGDAPEKLADRLSKFSSGAAYVSATAESAVARR